MLTFFRRIRQSLFASGTTSKYILYAAGEVLLVMIGILLALQVNNWNENRISLLKEKNLFDKILRDLEISMDYVKTDLEAFKRYQSLHLQMFNETKGKASFNPDIKYHELRWFSNYNSIITDNYSNTVSDLSNERVRDALNNYLKVEKQTVKAFENWDKLKLEFVRPYTLKHGILNSDVIFKEIQSNWINILDMEFDIVSYEKLQAQYGSTEFDQLISSLWIITGYVIYCLENQVEQIIDLKICIEGELSNDNIKNKRENIKK